MRDRDAAGHGGPQRRAPRATPHAAADRHTLATESSAALAGFTDEDPTLQALLDKSVGYAVFPQVGKAGFVVGVCGAAHDVLKINPPLCATAADLQALAAAIGNVLSA